MVTTLDIKKFELLDLMGKFAFQKWKVKRAEDMIKDSILTLKDAQYRLKEGKKQLQLIKDLISSKRKEIETNT